ncbi:MAG: hypothetical protein UW18_C0015G0004 [Microgenomates group bacterium GW2011_GWF1_44_10]|nr:MAG: hypothetical protein UW18_C0015G0004 [Microgenomates group bacterium GW2011_GWF1_44_10]
MTPATFASYVRYKTKTNSTTLPDAEILAYMAVRQDELAKDILDADENILLIPQYTSLVAGQREYPLPQDMLASIKRVEVKIDGTNFIKLEELDSSKIKTTINTESEIIGQFSNEADNAFFSLNRKSIVIYSGTITSVTDGLKILVNTWPTPISDLSATNDMSQDPSTTTHGIPRELHEIWARGVIIEWKGSKEKPIPLNEKELSYKVDKIIAINSLKPQNQDRTVQANIPSGTERWNDGADL